MRLRKIRYVDVIADASTVGSVVVIAENRHWLSGDSGPHQKRDEVRLGFVLLAEAGFQIRSARVEISQGDAAQPTVIQPLQHLLHQYLGLAIRINWIERQTLWNRH